MPGRNGGELLRYPKGSNGGVHRGPDLHPRRVVQAIYLKALTDEFFLALPMGTPPASKRSGAAVRKRARARRALIENMATLVNRVVLEGAEGNESAWGPGIRILTAMHEAFQPTKAEEKNGLTGHRQPFGPNFIRPGQQPPPAPAGPPADEEPPVRDADGKAYVEVD